MEAIILAGGAGTRLRSVVANRPKALAPINGEPFLRLLLRQLASASFRRVILATGYLGGQVREAIGEKFEGMEIVYSQEEEPLGTGGALARALLLSDEPGVFAMNGDTWIDMDFAAAWRFWQNFGGIVMAGVRLEDTGRYGRLELKDGLVVGFGEKSVGGPGWINAGCYIFPRNVFVGCRLTGAFSLEKNFLEPHAREYPVHLFETDGNFIDIGVPEDYKRFEEFWLEGGS